MLTAVVAERGQVTIPKALRDRMGIRPSTVLEFTVKDGALIAIKAVKNDPVSSVLGCLKTGRSSDDWMRALRGKP